MVTVLPSHVGTTGQLPAVSSALPLRKPPSGISLPPPREVDGPAGRCPAERGSWLSSSLCAVCCLPLARFLPKTARILAQSLPVGKIVFNQDPCQLLHALASLSFATLTSFKPILTPRGFQSGRSSRRTSWSPLKPGAPRSVNTVDVCEGDVSPLKTSVSSLSMKLTY